MKKFYLLLVLTLTVAGFAQAATETVEITDSFAFSPEHIQIKVGDTLEFVNKSGARHTVTADPKLAKNPDNVILPPGAAPFHSGFISSGKKYTLVLTVPGLYQYVCLPHESMGMMGQIEVLP